MAEQAKALLALWAPDARVQKPRNHGEETADLVVHMDCATLVLELKRLADPGWLRGTIAQTQSLANRYGPKAVPVIVVPFMGEGGRRLCREAKVSWFDLSGNADILAPGLRVYVEGKPNIFRRPGRPATVFSPKSSRLVRTLLRKPSGSLQQRELARDSALDEGFTSRIVRKLIDDRLLRRTESGALVVVDPNLLLDAWRDSYAFSKHHVVMGHVTARSGEEAMQAVARALGDQYAVTGLAAAWLLTQFATFRLSTFFLPEQPSTTLMKEIRFRPESRGANVWLVVPNDEGVFSGADNHRGVRCVHPVQAYIDLGGHPERSAEAAQEVRRRLLNWKRHDD